MGLTSGAKLWTQVPARVRIDPNVRVADNLGRARLSRATGSISVGQQVTAFEPESGTEWTATVARIDAGRDFVYLRVDWSSLREGSSDDGGGDPVEVHVAKDWMVVVYDGPPLKSAPSGDLDLHLMSHGVGGGHTSCLKCTMWSHGIEPKRALSPAVVTSTVAP